MNDKNVPRETSTRPEDDKSQEGDVAPVVNSSAIQQAPPQKPQPKETKDKKKPAIRHAEKRRTSTCRFADRVAKLSVDHYKATIPTEKRPPQTCIATILAHYRKPEDCRDNKDDNDNDLENHDDDHESDNNQTAGTLWILSMGVGTKFLSESCLRKEVENENEDGYGSRVRDMHAEVLARRAFRRQLTLEIQEDLQALEKEQTNDRSSSIDMDTLPFHRFGDRANTQERNLSILVRSKSSERHEDGDSNIRYMLRPGVTLHMYTSSAPCGNATLKKFCKMSKERFRDDLGPDEWPDAPHEPPPGHSIKLGEFSLLVKRDNTNMATAPPMDASVEQDTDLLNTKKRTRIQDEGSSSHKIQSLHGHKPPTRRGKPWPATLSDDWTPPGTTIVGFQHKGSIHTCSDKICRWNYLGLQGSLLSGILEEPLYLSTLTVGRKLSGAVCRRAICCRLDTRCEQPKLPKSSEKSVSTGTADNRSINENKYRVNHPAVMGTSVYLDTGIVDTSNVDERGQDVRFHSSLVWCWWSGLSECANRTETSASSSNNGGVLECIESSSGFLANLSEDSRESHDADTDHVCSIAPMVSTKELTSLYLQVHHRANPYDSNLCFNNTLSGVREIKKICSPMHETFKDLLLTEHKVLSHWRRREDRDKCINCTTSS